MAGLVLGHQDLEGQVEGGAGGRKHERGAGGGISEDEELGVGHGEAGFGGFSTVVDHGEEGDALRFERGAEAGHGFRHAVGAGDGGDAVGWGLVHGTLRTRLWGSSDEMRGVLRRCGEFLIARG